LRHSGVTVGNAVGALVGAPVGDMTGACVGATVGGALGDDVGEEVGGMQSPMYMDQPLVSTSLPDYRAKLVQNSGLSAYPGAHAT